MRTILLSFLLLLTISCEHLTTVSICADQKKQNLNIKSGFHTLFSSSNGNIEPDSKTPIQILKYWKGQYLVRFNSLSDEDAKPSITKMTVCAIAGKTFAEMKANEKGEYRLFRVSNKDNELVLTTMEFNSTELRKYNIPFKSAVFGNLVVDNRNVDSLLIIKEIASESDYAFHIK